MMARSGIITSVSSRWRVGASSRGRPPVFVLRQPNRRLKLPGGDRFKGSGVLYPWGGTDFVPHPCAGARVARSLSASR